MKTTHGWGWLVAGVLVLGLNGIYHDGGAAWAHQTVGRVIDRIEARTGPVLALVAGRADLFTAKTGIPGVRVRAASCRATTGLERFRIKTARIEMDLAGFELISARQQAALARMEANRARIAGRVSEIRFAPAALDPVVCPRVSVSISR